MAGQASAEKTLLARRAHQEGMVGRVLVSRFFVSKSLKVVGSMGRRLLPALVLSRGLPLGLTHEL